MSKVFSFTREKPLERPIGHQGRREMKPDYVYDPDDWECTYEWSDRSEMVENYDLDHGAVKKFNTLVNGPPKFAVNVILARDEAGDVEDDEIQWFDNEDEAKAAAARMTAQPSAPSPLPREQNPSVCNREGEKG